MPEIVTLTMNPALDITTSTNRVAPTDKVRCGAPRRDPGGGGLNVARVLHVLGTPATAVFPSGGHTGRALEDLVATEGVPIRSRTIRGSTRESLTINENETGLQYRFVLPGPIVTAREQMECLDLVTEVASGADYVVVSGSLPPGVPADFYQQVADVVGDLGARVIVDTSGPALRLLRGGVFLVKPSIRELRDWTGRELSVIDDQVAATREIIDRGVCEVIVLSLGADGALLVTRDRDEYFPSVDVAVVSGVGAGDSMVAGVICGLARGRSLSDSVRYGIAAGAAMLQTPGTALCRRADVERFYALLTDGSAAGTTVG
ncbi:MULTISPECIES: 1-phosphofructokinase family hexose kinase [unclassified Rhodococcus (in: high G+C Gram-positive bacteria)]|uniref:1-phosphofructokinase family hexose kinase n=1 Tax=unclassified Rhodococcus (in: high G+C Gram-positive bacteria) TaxID=192944 RepID=UPI0002E752AD|nr:1-phosphofructokinase family hexose kinase [Rhodococcus sp. DK17]